MKRLGWRIAVMSMFVLVSANAFGDEWFMEFGTDGNELITACKSAVQNLDDSSRVFTKQQANDIGFCMGFVAGIADSVQDDTDLRNTKRAQLVRVVQKYLEEHPEELSKGASWLVRRALVTAFPKARGGAH
jgi:hypothetical protein